MFVIWVAPTGYCDGRKNYDGNIYSNHFLRSPLMWKKNMSAKMATGQVNR